MGAPSTEIPFKIRVAVALLREGKLLLLRQNNHPFWVLPGGTLEPDEDLAQCAVRELMEETGLTITVGPLLYVTNFIQPQRHVVDVFFRGEYVTGELPAQGPYPENIDEMGFFSFEEVQAMVLRPGPVGERLLVDWADGFKTPGGVYLGLSQPTP